MHSNFKFANFCVKLFSWGTIENLFTWIFSIRIFSYTKIFLLTVFAYSTCMSMIKALFLFNNTDINVLVDHVIEIHTKLLCRCKQRTLAMIRSSKPCFIEVTSLAWQIFLHRVLRIGNAHSLDQALIWSKLLARGHHMQH